ncbi:biliverdin-producing heme oxygenase [Thalassospira profundimaris]|uniref:biliverdin-producing heme oxygenase n=1 Tax=Thalassospira profundimaris TaxID=502049 RepID=UPI00028728F8|nr:biliverdin-producing heme oxygenase [Thalassospira profundimaris]EKF10246.1 heme oxygenase [Thalassospira profundimaris WP0211]
MTAQIGQPTRLEEIKQSTRSDHQSVDDMVMAMAPFDSRTNYLRFLRLQHIFHGRMKPLYEAPDLNEVIPGLASRSRYVAVCADMSDLECEASEDRSREPIKADGAERIGWLYVCEGSSLGAAFLLKAADKIGLHEEFGARHLAGHAQGRGKHWREFVEQVNGLALDAQEEQAVRDGAVNAFAFFRGLVVPQPSVSMRPESLG